MHIELIIQTTIHNIHMCVLNTFYDNTLMFYIRKENLALNKPMWQKHPWQDSTRDFGSENAVDGLYSDRGI